MNRKILKSGCLSLLLLTWFFSTSTAIWWFTVPKFYFLTFKDTTAVEAHMLSRFTLNQTTLDDVQNLIADNGFREMDCHFHNEFFDEDVPQSDDMLSCSAPTGLLWWHYYITFDFEHNILIDVTVSRGYRGL